MSRLNDYLAAADRDNTRRSYASAIRHFEIEWGGLLPATSDAVARYLADHAATLSLNTLRHRLSVLSRWHVDQGFADPTKAPLVRQTFKGIRSLHPATEKQARPLELDVLEQVDAWLDRGIAVARNQSDRTRELQHTRDRALLLLGFWRGFRSDELVRLRIEHVDVVSGQGMTCFLPRSKGDRQLEGRRFQCPALSRLCPVTAFESWIALSGLGAGPVFRRIGRWGDVAETGLQPNSLIPLLRRLFAGAGVSTPDTYSSHSLRRGFAGWARASGWDLKDLMAYVGWRDIRSAMRYFDATATGLQARFELGLQASSPSAPPVGATAMSPLESGTRGGTAIPTTRIQVDLVLTRFSKGTRGLTQAHRLIEQMCFQPYGMQRLDKAGEQVELLLPCPSREALDDLVFALLDDMHRIADDNHCSLEARFHEPATGKHWD
ncbi:MAG: tyrosine-type recombinase/integrase [Dechloromonas sp.]|nr:tyrosine-type recombinase/integrase [Dechloromonas sp.]